jgi:hypothetical protein
LTLQQAPYLREQRQFPNDDVKLLSNQMDHTYIDIAAKVNVRTIGIFAKNFQILTGESWYFAGSSQKKQGLRQIYPFTAAGNIAHGINFADVFQFTKPSGSFTDGTNWYGAIWASNVAIAGQVSFYVDPTNIVILSGGGAPAIVSGTIVLEWISNTGA